jgi:hypothetical protein
LMRTPGDPNSAAQARVRVSMAPFVDAYSAPTGIPNRATQEPAEVDDRSRSAGGHFGCDCSCEEERRLDVDRIDLVEYRFVDGRRGRAREDPRAVDEHVDPAVESI